VSRYAFWRRECRACLGEAWPNQSPARRQPATSTINPPATAWKACAENAVTQAPPASLLRVRAEGTAYSETASLRATGGIEKHVAANSFAPPATVGNRDEANECHH